MSIRAIIESENNPTPDADPTKQKCPHCGYKTLKHHLEEWDPANYRIYCDRCGYFQYVGNGFVYYEGMATPVECYKCHRCQVWVNVPIKVRKLDREALRLFRWTCGVCNLAQSVFDSEISLDEVKPEGMSVIT